MNGRKCFKKLQFIDLRYNMKEHNGTKKCYLKIIIRVKEKAFSGQNSKTVPKVPASWDPPPEESLHLEYG